MNWFTADYHLYHKNIIEYCNRPFTNVEEMNATIVKNLNKSIKFKEYDNLRDVWSTDELKALLNFNNHAYFDLLDNLAYLGYSLCKKKLVETISVFVINPLLSNFPKETDN